MKAKTGHVRTVKSETERSLMNISQHLKERLELLVIIKRETKILKKQRKESGSTEPSRPTKLLVLYHAAGKDPG